MAFDQEKFQQEVEAELEGLPHEKCVAFAVRSAMRVLPLLGVDTGKEAFRYCLVEEKTKHLLAFWRIYACCNGYCLLETPAASRAAAYAADTADTANTTDDVGYAAYAAAYAAEAATDIDVFYEDDVYLADADAATYAADAATYAIYVANAISVRCADAIIQEIKNDLAILKSSKILFFMERGLWENGIADSWQKFYEAFKQEVSRLNAGFDIWLHWYEQRLQGQSFDLKQLEDVVNLSEEILSQDAAQINAYLKGCWQQEQASPLNRVRAIFIGYGEAGKTSLVRVLHNEPVVAGKEKMTAGIDIRDWDIPDSDIKAHFWDFGGQVMAHATHQFFLRSSCLYVLVLNARSEINSTEQTEYWLEHVKAFGGNAPVMIVGNKVDLTPINLDMGYLTEKYPNIVDFYPLSCTQAQNKYKAKFDSFKQDFCQQLKQVGTHQMLFSNEQFAVLEKLREESPKAAFLPHEKFEKFCEQSDVPTEGELNRDWLLDILDKLGVIIHFPQIAYLDEYVLNPRWLTYGVYTLMYGQQPQLNETQVVKLLSKKKITEENGCELKYPAGKCGFIMRAMQEFKLCYPLHAENGTYIIPELLPSDRPKNLSFNKTDALAFEFKFTGFLPRHIVPELIVTHHQEIIDQTVWQNGVLLQSQNENWTAQALLEVSYHDRIIHIWVQGRDAKDYLALLNNDVLAILGRLELDYEQYIELPLSACVNQEDFNRRTEKVDYNQLLNSIRSGIHLFPGKYNTYDLSKVLGVIIPESAVQHINIQNYVGRDANHSNLAGRDMRIQKNN